MVATSGRRFIYRSVWIAAALTAVGSFGVRVPAQAPPPAQYGVTPLGALGGAQSAAYGIGYGLGIVGRAQAASGAYHAFAEGSYGLKDLGTLGGADSTAFAYGGLAVGQAQTASGAYHAFSYDLNTNVKTDLGTLGGTFSAAYGNVGGFTVGASRTAGNTRLRAFEYVNGAMTALPVDTGGDSAARAISTSGEIVGYTCTSGATGCRPFLLAGGTVTLLGASDRTGVATGVNSAVQVVGSLSTGPGTNVMHAFLYSGGVTTDLGTLGGAASEARGIDEMGNVVGSAQNAAGQPRAFLWRGGQMIDLTATLVGAPGWVLESAAGIIDSGQIVGYGTFQGKRRAFLLTPPVDLAAFAGGSQSQRDSNAPHNGIEVGKRVEWVTSAVAVGGAPVLTFLGAHMVHTLTGPAVFEDVQSLDGLDKCTFSPTVITCDLGPMEGTGGEIAIHARALGPGPISHHATVSSTTPDPNSTNNSITETNRAVALSTFAISPATVAGGQVAVGTLTLTDLPPGGDALVTLKSSRPDIAAVSSPFDIPAFASQTRQFHIIPANVSTPTIVQISASYGLVTITKTLTVVPTALRQLYLTPATAIGGCGTIAGRILLTGNAPPGGVSVPLTNTNSKAAVPSAVTVPGGANDVRFNVPTTAVTANASGHVTASFGGVSQTLTLNVRPIRAQTLTLSPNRVRGGGTVNGTVSLECAAAPGAVGISLASSNTAVATPAVPSITLAAGATSGTFSVKTAAVTVETPVTISAWVFGVRKTVTLTVTP